MNKINKIGILLCNYLTFRLFSPNIDLRSSAVEKIFATFFKASG